MYVPYLAYMTDVMQMQKCVLSMYGRIWGACDGRVLQ